MNTPYFTCKGDQGESHLGKVTLSKGSSRAELLGGLDELNSWIGFARVEAEKENFEEVNIASSLRGIQEIIFIAQAEVASMVFELGGDKKIKEENTKSLEEIIIKIDEVTPPLSSFLIPGGTELAARLDVIRTIARRVERIAKRYMEELPNDTPSEKALSFEFLKFMNRLSSVFFALSRYVNLKKGIKEEGPTYK